MYQIAQNAEIGIDEDTAVDRIDSFWQNIDTLTWTSSGFKKYPLLCKLSKCILLIPHSNAYCETMFNMVRKVPSRFSNSVCKDTKEACSSTSVYSDFTGIRNTLVAILSSKINLFSTVSCHEWKPSEQLVKKAKSITYTTLKQRRDKVSQESRQ